MSEVIPFLSSTHLVYGGLDPLWSVIYDVTGGWRPGQTTVNVAAGFGDGVSNALAFGFYSTADARGDMGIDGGVDPCSDAYNYSKVAGEVEGALTGADVAVKSLGKLGTRAFRPGGWTNSNRYLRIGFGRNGGSQTFRAAGQWVQKATGKAHVDFWNGGPL